MTIDSCRAHSFRTQFLKRHIRNLLFIGSRKYSFQLIDPGRWFALIFAAKESINMLKKLCISAHTEQ